VKNAIFKIWPDISQYLLVGFFDRNMEYPAIVGFSNASGKIIKSDDEPDLRGIAIEVKVRDDKHYDFLMTNAEEHHARDAEQAMIVTEAAAEE
jgi:catalase